MRWRFSILPLAIISMVVLITSVFYGEEGAVDIEERKKEAVSVVLSPVSEVSDVFEARRELNKLKEYKAEAESAKELTEKSYETLAKEAELERKRADDIEKKIEGLKGMLKSLKEKEAIKETKEKIKELKGELEHARDRNKLAVQNADMEIKNAEDLGRKIALFDEKIEKVRLKINYEMGDFYNKFVWKILVFVSLLIVVFVVRIVLLKLVSRYIERDVQKYYYNKIIKVGSWTVIIIFILSLLIGKVEHFMLLISFVSAGVAIALKDVIASFVAWFFIVGPNGFRVSDRIELGDVRGDVVDISLFRTTLMEIASLESGEQAVGRIATFPNQLIFAETLYNYTTGSEFVWNEISFLVTFESNWGSARELMLGIACEDSDKVIREAEQKMKSMSTKYMVRFGVLTPAVYVKVADSGVELTVRYITDARLRRVTHDRISKAILDAIYKADDINFAYPTIRYYKRGECITNE